MGTKPGTSHHRSPSPGRREALKEEALDDLPEERGHRQSKTTLGKLLIDRVERIWALPSASIPS